MITVDVLGRSLQTGEYARFLFDARREMPVTQWAVLQAGPLPLRPLTVVVVLRLTFRVRHRLSRIAWTVRPIHWHVLSHLYLFR